MEKSNSLKRGFSFLPILILLIIQQSFAGKLFLFTTPSTSDNSITFSDEARDYVANNNIDYNLDPSMPSPLGNRTGVKFVYLPSPGGINDGDIIVFSITNGYFSEKMRKCWLVFYEQNGIDNDFNGIGDRNYDYNHDGDSLDSIVVGESIGIYDTEIYMRIVESDPYPSGGLLYLACAEDNEPPISSADSDSMAPITYDEMYNLVINFKKRKPTDIGVRGSDESNICLNVSEAYSCCPQAFLDDLTTDDVCFIKFKKQFSLSIHPSLSVIDTYPESLGSVDCSNSKDGIFKCYDTSYKPGSGFEDITGSITTSDSCTDRFATGGWIRLENDPSGEIEDYIHIGTSGWKAKFYAYLYDVSGKYSCDNSSTGYKGLDLNRVFIDNNGNKGTDADLDHTRPGINDIKFKPGRECSVEDINVLESGTASSTKIILPHGGFWEDDIYVGVTGNDRLKWVKWGLNISLSIIAPDNTEAYTYEMDETDPSVIKLINSCCYENDPVPYFLKWEPNGDEAYIPHLLNNSLTYVKISNNSCWDAEVYARVWDEKGHVVDNVYLGTVPAHGGKIVWGNEIFAKAHALNPEIGGGYGTFSAILTVGAPKRDVEFAVGDSRAGKGKMLPVYDLNGEELYYRNVDFDEDIFEK